MSATLVLDVQASADHTRLNRPVDHVSAADRQVDPELSLYRSRCISLLRRYFRMSLELGRMPNILGREFFRSKVTSYRITTFEDVVILVHDVDRCLARLEPFEQQMVATVVLEEYSHSEAAALLHCTRRSVTRCLPDALDLLSQMFLDGGLLLPLGQKRRQENRPKRLRNSAAQKTCQEGKNDDFPATP